MSLGNRVERKCGTCKYFREAGIANSGWCKHPQRAELNNLVLVRRTELACRNTMDSDLWEPGDGLDLVPHKPPELTDRVIHASTADSPASHPAATNQPTDKVTSIAVPANPPQGASRSESVRPPVRTQHDADNAGLRPEMAAVAGASEPARQPGDSTGNVAEPHYFGRKYTSPFAPPHTSQRHGSQEFDAADRAPDIDWTLDPVGPRRDNRPIPGGVSRDRRLESVIGRVSSNTEPLPDLSGWELSDPLPSVPEAPLDYAGRAPGGNSNGTSGSGAEGDKPLVFVDGLQNVTSDPEFDRRIRPPQPLAAEPDPIDQVPWVASIPRCCDTCRDFRRNPDGRTGYCSNVYAFPQPTMVECHQLACRSSMGVWWLPSDDVWLERADISHHTRPTPYLEAALAGAGKR